jgi:hypothetical protein
VIGDSQACRDQAIKEGSTKRNRHFDRATQLFKRLFMLDVIAPWLVKTAFMVADILTKATDKDTFYKMRAYMNNYDNAPDPVLHGQAARLWNKLKQKIH